MSSDQTSLSKSALAISARCVSKSYSIARSQHAHSTLAEAMLSRIRHPFRKTQLDTFHALDNVNFEINRGDVVGVIGRNGAGKSTLLKILSRITEPSSGQIDLYGRVGSLLEVGTGFHPELTGRENVFLNGHILGMKKAEISRQFDAIVDFSGVEKFLDTPVKRYSSGMYVRLAFAVAAHLQTDILLVDEVLAVGDAEFQRKCLGKMKDVSSSGRTVLFVSHHMQSVQVLCNKGMYLEKGTCSYYGEVAGAIEKYVQSFDRPTSAISDPDRRRGSGEFRFSSVTPSKEFFTCGEPKSISFQFKRKGAYAGRVFVSCQLVNDMGSTLLQCDSRMVEHWLNPADEMHGQITIKTPWLKPGNYRMDMFICSEGIIDWFEDACRFEVIPLLPYPASGNTEATSNGLVFADFEFVSSSAKGNS